MRILIAILFLAATLAFGQTGQSRRGNRNDAEIEQQLKKYMNGKDDFKRVVVHVEDGVVELSGHVELSSDRVQIVNKARSMKRVSSVRDSIVLDPVPVADEQLLGRIKQRLDDPRYSEVKFSAHEGLVRFTGRVRNHSDYVRLASLAWNTPGVKEVQLDVQVLSLE